jgi:GGDEF domain-containing protein
MENEDMRFKRNRKSFSLLFADIDFFTSNDTHGYASGNNIFIGISNILNTEKREAGQVGRWGSAYSEDTNIEKTIDQADQRLYIAKNRAEKNLVRKMRKLNQ